MQQKTNTSQLSTKRQISELKILTIAKNLFSLQGFNRTTTREIAKQAQLAEGLIFKYFENKQGLLNALLANWTQQNIQELENLPTTGTDLKAELQIILNWMFNSYIKNHELHKIAADMFLKESFSPEFLKKRQEYFAIRANIITSRLQQLKDQGKINPQTNLTILYETMQSYALAKSLFTQVKPNEAKTLITQFTELMTNGLV